MTEEVQKEATESLLECKLKLREAKYEPIFIALQGVQNYGLEYSGNRFYFKSIICPQLRDFVFNKKFSFTVKELDNGRADIKSFSSVIEQWEKGEITFIELLFSDVQWCCPKYPELNWFINHQEEIAHVNEVGVMESFLNIIKEKRRILCHTYPVQMIEVQKYEYSSEQLSFILRLFDMMKRYNKEPFKDLLEKYDVDFFRDIVTYKKVYEKNEAIELSNNIVRLAEEFFQNNIKSQIINQEFLKEIKEKKYELIKRAVKNEIEKEEEQ